MAALFLTEDDVRQLLTMGLAIEAVENGFRRLANGDAMITARRRVWTRGVMLHTMAAASESDGLVGFKAYTTGRSGSRFHLVLYDGASGEMVSMMEADWLGRVRTGAASGVATRLMARPDACRIGLFGAGKQARTQLEAVCAVRPITEARVFSRGEESRQVFAREMSGACGIPVLPVERAEEAAIDMDIIVTATTSKEPVLNGRWLTKGTHINAIGSNALGRAELDSVTIGRADLVVVDSLEQAMIEAGDFATPIEQGTLTWSRVHELADVVVARQIGRPGPASITLFKSLGVAMEDLAVAAQVLIRARQAGVGRTLPW